MKSKILSPGGKRANDLRARQAFQSKQVHTEVLSNQTNEMFDMRASKATAIKKKMSVDTSVSTSVGSTERLKNLVMLPRDHGMTKE